MYIIADYNQTISETIKIVLLFIYCTNAHKKILNLAFKDASRH